MGREPSPFKLGTILFWTFCLLVFTYLVFPITIILPISFSASEYLEFPPRGFSLKWYAAYFESEEWLDPTLQSLKVALLTMIFSTVVGTLAAFGLVRGRFRGKRIIQSFIISPMIIPHIIIAIGVYFLFASWHLVGKTTGIVLGHLPLTIPFVVVTVSASLYGFNTALEDAAQTLGANRIKTFYYVTYPLIQPGILAGALFAFIISFDELIVALFICETRAVTLPKRMFDALMFEISPVLASISTLLVLLSVVALIGMTMLRKRTEGTQAKKKVDAG